MELFSPEATCGQFDKVFTRGLTNKEPYWNLGYPILSEKLPDLERGLWFIASPENVGKCARDVVLLESGEYKFIADLKEGDKVWTLGSIGLEAKSVIRTINSGIKPTYRVRLYDGSEVVITKEHPFLTRKGWVPLTYLGVGDEVGVPNELPCGKETWNKKELRLLGYLIGDGGVANNTPTFTNEIEEIVEDFRDCLPDGFELVHHSPSSPSYCYRIRGKDSNDNSSFRVWCESMGIWGKHSWEKELPSFVFTLNEESIIEIIRGLLATDGHKIRGRKALEYTTTSKTLAYQMKSLFLRLGIRVRLSTRPANRKSGNTSNAREAYRLYVGSRGCQLDKLFGKLRIPGKNVGEHPVVQWFKIVAIQYLGDQEVFDIEVEGTHNFIGGHDIFLHNSQFLVNLGNNILKNNPTAYWLDLALDDYLDNRIGYLLACAGDLPISLVKRVGDAPDEQKQIRKKVFEQFLIKNGGRYQLLSDDGKTNLPVNIFDVNAVSSLIEQARSKIGASAKLFVSIDGFHDLRISSGGSEETVQQKNKSQVLKNAANKHNALIVMTAQTRKDSRSRNLTPDVLKGEDTPVYDAVVITHLYSDVNHNRNLADIWWEDDAHPGTKLPVHEVDILKNKVGNWKGVLFYTHIPSRCQDYEVNEEYQEIYREILLKKAINKKK